MNLEKFIKLENVHKFGKSLKIQIKNIEFKKISNGNHEFAKTSGFLKNIKN